VGIQNIELHRVVATAIIHKDGKFLIVQRNPNKRVFPGRWTVPGGGLSVVYLLEKTKEKICLSREASEFRYFSLKNLPKKIGFDHRKILNDLKKKKF